MKGKKKMKAKRLLVILLSFVLLIGSVFAVGASADEVSAPELKIVSKNISYDGDLKLVVAVPKDSFDGDITLTVEWTELVGTNRADKKVETKTDKETLLADGIADPTLGGVECVAIMAKQGVSAKDMGTELTVTVTAGEATHSEKYSVLEYVYTKLYEEEILYAEAGSPNAARRELYLSTINFAKYAEKVLYDNLTADESDNLKTHADEWIFSDLEGSPKLYTPGSKIAISKYTKLLQYTLRDGAVEAEKTFSLSGEITLQKGVSFLENPDKTETFDEGVPGTEFITPAGDAQLTVQDGVLVSSGDTQLSVKLSDRAYDSNKANDTYVFTADFYLGEGEQIGTVGFRDADNNYAYLLYITREGASYISPVLKQNTLVSDAFVGEGWHTLKVELYTYNNRAKVYVDGVCYLGYIDASARECDFSALTLTAADLSLTAASYDNIGFEKRDITYTETVNAVNFENGAVADAFGHLTAGGDTTALSVVSDVAGNATKALKVALASTTTENPTVTLGVMNENPQGSLYVFEMDIKGTSYCSTGDRALMTLTFGNDTANKFILYNKYGVNNNWGVGMGFGLGGRNILNGAYANDVATDTSPVIPFNEWYTLRLELDLGETPEVRVLVKSSATAGKMLKVASITPDGTTVDALGITKTTTSKLNVSALKNISAVNLAFNKANTSNTYFDNLSFTQVANEADGETRCEHGNDVLSKWQTAVPASCTTNGTDARICSCGFYSEQKVTLASGHDYSDVLAVNATCISEGHSAYEQCNVCGDILGEVEIYEKLPHNIVESVAVNNLQTLTCTAGCNYVLENWVAVPGVGNSVVTFDNEGGPILAAGDKLAFMIGALKAGKTGDAPVAIVPGESVEGGNNEVWYSLATGIGGKVDAVLKAYNPGNGDTHDSGRITPSLTYDAGKGEKYIVELEIFYEAVGNLPHQFVSYDKQYNPYRKVVEGKVYAGFTMGEENVLIPTGEWVKLRFEFTEPTGGAVTDYTLALYQQSSLTDGVFKQVGFDDSFAKNTYGRFYISDYCAGVNTYYLNDISYSRIDTTCYHADHTEWQTVTPATCTTTGLKQATCNICNETITDEIPMLAHTESDWIIDTPAGCVTDGSKHKECTVCHTVLATEVIPANGDHDIGGWTEVDGGYMRSCANCDTSNEYTETIDGGVIHFNDGTILSGNLIDVTVPGGTMNDAGTEIGNTNTTLSIVNNVKDRTNNVLKVYVNSADKNVDSTSIKVNLADENAVGNILTFEMDFGIWNNTNSSNATNAAGSYVPNYLFNIKIGNNNFQLFPQYGTQNYGKGINFGIGGRNILSGEYTYDETKDNAFLLPTQQWNAIRLEIDVDKGVLKTYVKSSVTSDEMMLVSTTTASGTTMESITSPGGVAVTRTSSAKLNTTGLADVKSAEIQIHQYVSANNSTITTGYLDNISLTLEDKRCKHTGELEWNTVVAPTCTATGLDEAICPDCGETLTRETEMLEHSLIDVDGKPATCVEDGYTAHKACVNCDYTEGKNVISASGNHDIGGWTEVDGGYMKGCSTCDTCNEFTETIEGGVVHFNDGTILGGGKIKLNNGGTEIEGANGTTLIGNANTKFQLRNDVKGKVGNYVLEATVDPTNNASFGYTSLDVSIADENAVGGMYVFEMDVMSAKLYNSTVPLVQIMIGGDSAYKFNIYPKYNAQNSYGSGMRCGWEGTNVLNYTANSIVDGQADATRYLPHDEWSTVRLVYEIVDGSNVFKASVYIKNAMTGDEFVCFDTRESTISSTKAYSFVRLSFYKSANTLSYFDNLSFKRVESICDHELGPWEQTVAPTCTTAGERQAICSICGNTVTESVDALGHALYDVEGLDATCASAGYTAHKACSRCDYVEGKTVIEALPHSVGDWIIDAVANCTEAGARHNECGVCGATVESEVIPALGHSFGAWETWSKDANYEERQCSVCKRIQRQEKNTPITGDMTVSSVVNYTDALHANSISEGGKYNVFEMDFRLGTGATENSTVNHFRVRLLDGSNTVKYFNIDSLGPKVKIDGTTLDAKYVANDDNGTWITIRVVDEMPDAAVDSKYYHNIKVFVKLRDAEGEFELVKTIEDISTTWSHADRAYKVTFEHLSDESYAFTNASLIRTSDTSYFYGDCAHKLSAWEITPATCTTEGIATRACSVVGCKYTETEYIPALGHSYEYTDILNNKCTLVCANGCGYRLENWVIIPEANTPVDFEDNLLENERGHLNITVGALKAGTGNVTSITKDAETGAYPTEGGNDAIWYSLASNVGGRVGNALKLVTTAGNRDNFNSGRMDITKTAVGNAGDVYVFEFDTYIETLGSGSLAYQYVVLGQTINFYGRVIDGKSVVRLEIASTYLAVIPQDEWVSLRFEIYFPAGQEPANYSLKVYEKSSDTAGNFESQYNSNPFTSKNSTPLSSAYLSNYFGGSNVVYLDNISFTRVDTSCQHAMVDAWEQTLAPTCTTAGEKQAVCQTCGETVIAEIAPLGHALTDVDGKDATCTEAGYTAYKACVNCDYTEGYEAIDILPHTAGDWIIDAIATCTEAGARHNECGVCGATVESEAIPALGHEFGAWSEYALDANYEERQCSVCQRVQRQEKNAVISSIDTSTLGTTYGLQYTDALHAVSADKTGGKFIVMDFDVLFATTDASKSALTFTHRDDAPNGNNTLGSFSILVNGDTASVTNPVPVTIDGETYVSFRLVIELAEAKTNDKYTAKYTVFAREGGTSNPYVSLHTFTYSGTWTGHVGDTGNYFIQIKSSNPDVVKAMENVSLIRTADTNYLYFDHAHEFGAWGGTGNDCDTDGVFTRSCACGYVETEYILALGHNLSDWTDSDDGLTQQRACLREGCGEVLATRDKLTEGAVQFDDGTIAGSDKLAFSGVTLEDGASSAVTENDYITYSVVEAPDRPYDNALKVSAVLANRTSPSPNIYLSYMNDDAEGTVHTIDFDIYVVTPKTINSGRTLFQMAVGGSVFNVDTYSKKLRLFGDSSHLFGATDTWVSIRLQFVITENGSAELTAFYKNNGVYTQVRDSHTVTGSGLKVSGITEARMYMYITSEDLTYYIDNISYTRTECPHTFGDFVDSDSDGIRERTCTKCGETEYSEVALSGGTVNFDDGSILSNEKISVGVGTVTSAGAAAGLENAPAIQAGDSVGGNANTKFEIVSNAKDKANNCLKVTITPDKNGEYNYTTMTVARTDEDADGEIYVFEMDFKSVTQQNTTAPFVEIFFNGESGAKFDIFPYAQSAGGVRYRINNSYVADAPTVMPHNSWVTLRVVITGQTAYTFVKSSKTEGFQLLATNTLSLSNTVINNVKFNFYKTCSGMSGATCTTYFDNISLVQTSNTSYLPQ